MATTELEEILETLHWPTRTLADIVGVGGLPPGGDGITGDDFVAFINAFAGGCP